MTKWTVTDVAERFESAAYTLKRLPPVQAQGYFNAMPEVIRTATEKLQGDKLWLRLGSPTPEAISNMEETIQWVFWLEEEERRLVWLRAERVPWKRIYWRMGCGRTKAWHMWTIALLKIATQLNIKQQGG